MKAYLRGFGCYLPERVVTNAEIASRIAREPEWIEQMSGIQERRWAKAEETVADMALAAAQDCLQRAGLQPSQLGMLIVASGTAPSGFPGPAAEVADRLGLEGTPAWDLPIASAGALFGIALASGMVASCGHVLVIAAEKMSAVLEGAQLDPSTAILFGDGAGATLVSATPPDPAQQSGWEILDFALHTDGQFRGDLSYDGASALRMNGYSVIMQASRKLPAVIAEVLEKQKIAACDVRAFLVHQANQNLLARVAKSLKMPEERFYMNISRYGNTSSASLLIAAKEWADCPTVSGPIATSAGHPAPEHIVFAAFGAGFHWGALVAKRV
jgi:3-oxoacyl-[acyl-carrier-protein] synthase-3